MSVTAKAKGVRMSPRKVAVVADLVRGRSVEDAITILEHTPRRSALAVRKVIESARANADHNHNYKPESLQITAIRVSSGPSIKRYRTASHGRALPFLRRSSHIYVEVDGEIRVAKKPTAPKKEAK
ncbi:MAG TPA: 50S ribosomal protein L22 [Candidatus Saccharimonadales bacterium]|nr:50S ribosomal protein L22 [Candidatus Saccharimonadales bacterium]